MTELLWELEEGVDSFFSAQQKRLLIEPLYSSKAMPVPFLAANTIAAYRAPDLLPVVTDVLLELRGQKPDMQAGGVGPYIPWQLQGDVSVCIKIVQSQHGDELAVSERSRQRGVVHSYLDLSVQNQISFYAVLDVFGDLREAMGGALLRVWATGAQQAQEITPEAGLRQSGDWVWLEEVGLGLALWSGQFENVSGLWLRWCDRSGQVIATGAEEASSIATWSERAEAEIERANAAEAKSRLLADRLRAMGIDPEEV
jgi:hypothetical protein